MVLVIFSFSFRHLLEIHVISSKKMRVILAKKIRNFILEKPQILSNHGTGSMSCGSGAEQEASMLKKLAVVTSSKSSTIYSVPTHM